MTPSPLWTSCLGCPHFSCQACSALVYGAGSCTYASCTWELDVSNQHLIFIFIHIARKPTLMLFIDNWSYVFFHFQQCCDVRQEREGFTCINKHEDTTASTNNNNKKSSGMTLSSAGTLGQFTRRVWRKAKITLLKNEKVSFVRDKQVEYAGCCWDFSFHWFSDQGKKPQTCLADVSMALLEVSLCLQALTSTILRPGVSWFRHYKKVRLFLWNLSSATDR